MFFFLKQGREGVVLSHVLGAFCCLEAMPDHWLKRKERCVERVL
jgi:hypothetical protein